MIKIIMHFKPKKHQELDVQQGQWNRRVSKIRVKEEHVVASVKIFRKAKEKFRRRLFARDRVILTAGG